MQRPICLLISGTGTNVGKTFVTASLLRSLLLQGIDACAVKIIQTGCRPEFVQTDPLADIFHYTEATKDLAQTKVAECLTCFPLAASPHLAAKEARSYISVNILTKRIYTTIENTTSQVLLFETAGGLRVPLNEDEDTLDLIKNLKMPVLLCCDNTLGALNHALLSIDAVKMAGIPLQGLVLNETVVHTTALDRQILQDNQRYLKKRLEQHCDSALFFTMPYMSPLAKDTYTKAAQILTPLSKTLQKELSKEQTNTYEQFLQDDAKYLWHPYSKINDSAPIYGVASTYANTIRLMDGSVLIDGMSSWWSAVHGYKHPHIQNAIHSQTEKFPHVMFGGLTHENAVSVGKRLCSLLPTQFDHVFFSDSGSVAMEVAMKMALQYNYAKGETQRTRFLTPRGSYFGDTQGVLSLCDPKGYIEPIFTESVIKQHFIERPAARFDAEFAETALDAAKDFFTQFGDSICAVCIEPIVQGAGGMWFYHPKYLNGLATLCREYGCLLICDEIATGFGHTGKLFALEYCDAQPDIVCVGKALTGGAMSLAATLCTDAVAQGICAKGNPFMHGPTFMANPLALACANASLDILSDGAWKKQVKAIEKTMKKYLAVCKKLPNVQDVRVLGDIGVVETKEVVDAPFLTDFFTKHGVWIRPFSNLVYIMPPYISPLEDIKLLCQVIYKGLENLAAKQTQENK